MSDPLAWLAGITLVVSGAVTLELILGLRRMGRLSDSPPPTPGEEPHVTVVIAARDEERNLPDALRSVLAQDYPSFDVVAVDDRSADETGSILDRAAQADPRLHVVHVDELPPGWLGKNHALELGSTLARGELILFADADIVMSPSSLGRAVGYLKREGLDHVTSWPRFSVPGWLAELTVGFSLIGLLALFQPWKARNPKSRRHFGVGAFNLVVADAYRAAGGHQAIALRPDDDIKLGKLLKTKGFRQDVLDGSDLMSVEWYRDLGEMVRGLRKNSFAIVDYSLLAALASLLLVVVVDVWPTLALLLTSGAAFWLNLGIWGLGTVTCATAVRDGMRPWLAPAYPLAAVIMLYILTRSVGATLWHGGIEWRGTYYPLKELRGNRV